jgi:hypothetical protein
VWLEKITCTVRVYDQIGLAFLLLYRRFETRDLFEFNWSSAMFYYFNKENAKDSSHKFFQRSLSLT